jgi:type II secretory pathway pseudopilin PulG
MFCTRCGNANVAEARYCASCGKTLSEAVPKPVMQRPFVISLLAVVHFIWDPLMFAAGLAILAAPAEEGAARYLTMLFGGAMVVLGALGFATAVGLWRMKPFGRNAQIGLSAVGLLAIPVGTLISAAILWYLFTPQVRVLFSGKRADQLTPQEVLALQPSANGAAFAVAVVVGVFAFVGFIGIMSAIAIPNLLTAMQRSKQKRTIADMQSISASIQQYEQQHFRFPEATDVEGLRSEIAQAGLITTDGWASPMRYGTDGTNYWLISAGKDGKFETDDPREYASGSTTAFDADIVLVNGEFVRYPKGLQSR